MHLSDPFVPRLLDAFSRERGDLLVGRSLKVIGCRATARSRLYILGSGDDRPEFVAKVPLQDGSSEHPPLDARSQFDALKRSYDWFRDDDRHAVAEPVACLVDLGAVVMRYAVGPTLASTLARSLLDPPSSLGAVRTAGDFLRRFHAHGAEAGEEVDPRSLVEELITEEAEVLRPLELSLPPEVRQVLRDLPSATISARRVLKHGDYVGANLILARRDGVTMIDPALSEVGFPDDDLARFLAHLSSTTTFWPGRLCPPVERLRLSLEQAFLAGYGPLPNPPLLFELRLLRQHVLRWRRRVELSRFQRSGVVMSGRKYLVDMHMRRLLLESTVRLRTHLH